MPTTSHKVCKMPDGQEIPISGAQDPSSCRFQGGTIVDAGTPSPQRISQIALREQLDSPEWSQMVGDSHLEKREFGALLLSFPLCEVARQAPNSAFVRALDRLDTAFVRDVVRLMQADRHLRDSINSLIFRTASTASVVLATGGTDVGAEFNVPEALINDGVSLGDEVISRTGNAEMATAIRDAVAAAQPLKGLKTSAVLSALKNPPVAPAAD